MLYRNLVKNEILINVLNWKCQDVTYIWQVWDYAFIKGFLMWKFILLAKIGE